jgi:ABC-type multidrug transport system fused ATPase/permease subunit
MTLLIPRKPKITKPTGALPPPPIEAEDREEPYRPLEWPLIRRCLGMLRPYRKQFVIGISVCAVHVLLEMSAPKFIQHIADHTANYARQLLDFRNGVIATAPNESAAIMHLAKIVGLWACVFAASVFFQRLYLLILTGAGERVQFDFRRKAFTHLQQLSMSYYDKTKLGRIISRCTSDINAMREANVNGVNQVGGEYHRHARGDGVQSSRSESFDIQFPADR